MNITYGLNSESSVNFTQSPSIPFHERKAFFQPPTLSELCHESFLKIRKVDSCTRVCAAKCFTVLLHIEVATSAIGQVTSPVLSLIIMILYLS